jgi:hypothetical protein
MKISTLLLATVGALVVATGASAGSPPPNLIVDGDFSNPYGGSGYTAIASGTMMGPWAVSSVGGGATTDAVDLIGGYWNSPTGPGTGSVDLDGTSPGTISQMFTPTQSGLYDVSFDLSANPDGGETQKTLLVTIDGISHIYTPTPGPSGSPDTLIYTPEEFQVSLTQDTAYTLTFTSQDASTSPFGPVIGGVSVALPEPGTWGLMLVGLVGLGGALRARRNLAVA